MGGPSSGCWRKHKKITVEECLFIDINIVLRQGVAVSNRIPVFMKTSAALRRTQVASINFAYENKEGRPPLLTLLYLLKKNDSKQMVEEPISLQSSKLCSGGDRWWFTCPLGTKAEACFRQVGKLYLPPGGKYFGCRHCYDLTYRSCQRSHKKDWLYDWIVARVPKVTPRMVRLFLDSIWEKNIQEALPRWGVSESQSR